MMIRLKNEVVFEIKENQQISIIGYDWRNSILNWTINGIKPIYYISFEFLRFKVEWRLYGKPF